MTDYPKKLIEVALPLDDISNAASSEKDIHTGTISNLHTWWSRKPLSASRAILFAQLVNDPGYLETQNGHDWVTEERERLFSILRELVKHENVNSPRVIERARKEIKNSWKQMCELTGEGEKTSLPLLHDPFSGGGSIPLEALRLGLKALATDLNPVSVIMNKALIEFPQMFSGELPCNPQWKQRNEGIEHRIKSVYKGVEGLREDVNYYSELLLKTVKEKLQHLYPDVLVDESMCEDRQDLIPYQGQLRSQIATIWSRTVICSNPACLVEIPLIKKNWLSTHVGNEAWVDIQGNQGTNVELRVQVNGNYKDCSTINNSGVTCPICKVHSPFSYIREQGFQGKMGFKTLAQVLDGGKRRLYVQPSFQDEDLINEKSSWYPDTPMPEKALGFRVFNYGLTRYKDLFLNRQLRIIEEFSNELDTIFKEIALLKDDNYATAIVTYLAFGIDRLAQTNNTLVRWLVRKSGTSKGTPSFDRQIVSMIWEFSEGNVFGNSVGSWKAAISNVLSSFKVFPLSAEIGKAQQADASVVSPLSEVIISSDPPYYDNVGYADLSDFFYILLRLSLKRYYPNLFGTINTPKANELVVADHKHEGDIDKANAHFVAGLTNAFKTMLLSSQPTVPVTIYYAFKQSETNSKTGEVSSGWETFLAALIKAGAIITATWPVSTEQKKRMRAIDSNAMASSIILSCRKRQENASLITRGQFLRELEEELPSALNVMMGNTKGRSPIAPVDLAQASIGPGMGIFSKYSAVLEADGTPMSVRTALQLINRAIDEYLFQAESNLDAETRFCTAWFAQNQFDQAPFGDSDVLARGKGTSVETVQHAGVLEAHGGKVRLLTREELPDDYDPSKDDHIIIWETTQHLIKRLDDKGEIGAAELVRAIGEDRATESRALAYRLFQICDHNKWAEEARAYNGLIIAWPSIIKLTTQTRIKDSGTAELF